MMLIIFLIFVVYLHSFVLDILIARNSIIFITLPDLIIAWNNAKILIFFIFKLNFKTFGSNNAQIE